MENPQNFNALQTRPDAIGDNVTRIRDYQLSRTMNPPWVAERRIVLEQIYCLDDALDNNPRGLLVFLGDVFGFVVEVLQRLSQPLNLHRRPTCLTFS